MDPTKALASYIEDESGCWIWQRSKAPSGHGMVTLRQPGKPKTSTHAHRYMYQLLVGPIEPDLVLDHLCRNPPCVNPDHMEPVTLEENNRRRANTRSHCNSGHAMTAENTVFRSNTYKCRTCIRERDRQYKRRWRAENPGQAREIQRTYWTKHRNELNKRRRDARR